MTRSIQINDQTFEMHAGSALFWANKAMLMISDVHLGKISHFRKFGAAVPFKAIQKNFDDLTAITNYFKPTSVVFMGDLFHSSLNKEWELFEDWTKAQKARIILVAGNHDIISPLKYEKLNIDVVSEIVSEGFLLTHHPEEREGFFNFSGHIHPAIKLSGTGRQYLRLPCFYKTDNQMILPAFGEFTGTHTLQPTKDAEIFAVLDDAVFPVPIQEKKHKKRIPR